MSASIHDFVIVGGRVAGAAAALLLARQGARVLVLEEGDLGGDTLSTHYIWPRGARVLADLGLLEELCRTATPPIHGITVDVGSRVEGPLPVAAWCPRRTVLDRLLVDAARAAGAEIRHGVRVNGLIEERGRVKGVRYSGGSARAGTVVGADGRTSTVARLAGAEVIESHPPQTAGFYAYFDGLQVDGAEFWVRPGRLTYLWQTTGGLGLVYVAVAASGRAALRERLRLGFAAAAIDVPELRDRIAAARPVSRAHGFAGQGPARRRRSGPGWVLLGDAASFKDPTAGMGISEALADAVWLAQGADPGAARVDEAAAVYDACRSAAELAPEPWLVDAYREINGDPVWTPRLYRMLGGEVTPSDFFRDFRRREAARC